MKTNASFLSIMVEIMILSSCAPGPDAPPVILPIGGKVHWNESIGYWDRNGDGKADRIRDYWGSGYAREYFDDDFDGKWDGVEEARGYNFASGLQKNRIPEGLNTQDHRNIETALTRCIEPGKRRN